ncbi:hypothetical protein HPB51_015200 [Rhipicephalus microplus]|uniref:RING-CH-type domain-containing protein n=1 Tax=Rhipicephalus microplus TaxID=6941 RepID=A0A9J6DAD0_RHIMP|nr:hypothetical protein HPB51_015200 [Rhipicephalus microplus]
MLICDSQDEVMAKRLLDEVVFFPHELRKDESCAVPSSLPSGTKNSVSSEINDELQFMNASLKCGDGIVARSPDDRAPSLSIPALLSDFVDESADNFSQATPTGSSSENRNNGPVCRICHGGDQEGALESLCSCAGTMGFVHVSCLELWLNAQKVDYCELCGKLRHQSLWSTTMQPTSDNPRQNGGDDFAARFRHTSEPSLRIPELVKDSEDYPVDSNVSLDTQTGSPNGDGSSAPMGRICHGVNQERLESLCSCSSTLGFVHVSCLEEWIKQGKVDFCKLCGQRFSLVVQPSKVLRLFHWLVDAGRWKATTSVVRAVTVGHVENLHVRYVVIAPASSKIRFMLNKLLDLWKSFCSWLSTRAVRQVNRAFCKRSASLIKHNAPAACDAATSGSRRRH